MRHLLFPAAFCLTALPLLAATNAPAITIARTNQQVTVTFTAQLQSATNVSGPWITVTNAPNPFVVDLAAAHTLYRAVASGVESVFSARSIVRWTVAGPFQKHFELAHAGMPDGIVPPKREKPPFDGTLASTNATLPVGLRVRGNSSLQECPFPKMQLKVSKENRAGTPFADAREIKIGTHCAEGGRGGIGRLRDQRAAFREALAYETMAVLGFISPRVRRARIEYHDTTPPGQAEEVGWTVQRDAFIFDDVEVVAERLGGRALDDEEIEALTDAKFDDQLLTNLELLHALFGNWDYRLAQIGSGLWNTDVIQLANQQLVPVAGDFDLSSWVTEQARPDAPHDYRPDLPEIERQAHYETEQILARAGVARFEVGRNYFREARAAIEAQIASAEVDEPGRTNALRHVAAFYDALAEALR